MPHLVTAEGSSKVMLASKRDSSAASRSCLRLVAASTTVRESCLKPSSWRSRTPSVRLVASCISVLHQGSPAQLLPPCSPPKCNRPSSKVSGQAPQASTAGAGW